MTVLAQDDGDDVAPYTGLDIIFIVDQSGSMGGSGAKFNPRGLSIANSQPMDPNELRFQTVQAMVSWLGGFSEAAGPETTIRMAVIYFGTSSTVWQEWTTIPQPGLDWRTQEAGLRAHLSEESFRSNLYLTDVQRAFENAQQLFDELPPLPDGQKNLRSVVAVTDGKPCNQAHADNNNCQEVSWSINQLVDIENLTNSAFPEPDYRIYAIGIENRDVDPEGYWADLRVHWEAITNEPHDPAHAFSVSDGADMAWEVLRLMTDLTDTITNSMESFVVPFAGDTAQVFIPPYARIVRFNVYSASPTVPGASPVTIYKPDGSAIRAGDAGITVNEGTENIQVWTIFRPTHGDWRLNLVESGAKVRVQMDLSYIKAALVTPEPAPMYYQWQSIPIQPWLYFQDDSGSGGPVNVELSGEFPLQVRAQVRRATGVLSDLSLGENPATIPPPGALHRPQFTGNFVPNDVGEYTLGFIGEVPSIPYSRLPVELKPGGPAFYTPLDTRTAADLHTITVNPATVSPVWDPWLAANSNVWLQQDPMQLCLVIKDSAGAHIPSLHNLQVAANLIRPEDGALLQTASLVYQPDVTASCSFAGQITPNTVGNQTLQLVGTIPNPANPAERTLAFTEQRAEPITVREVDIVTIRAVEPQEAESTSDIREASPFWGKRPMTAAFTVVNQYGEPVNLEWFASSTDDLALSLEILNESLEPVTGDVTLHRINTGYYQVESKEHNGWWETYTIRVQGDPLELRGCNCAYSPGGNSAQRLITRQMPGAMLVQLVGGIMAGILLVFALIWFMARRHSTRKNPLTGQLYFILEQRDLSGGHDRYEAYPYDLGQFERNTIVLKTGGMFVDEEARLPHALQLPVKSVTITNRRQAESSTEATIHVSFEMEPNRQQILPVVMQGNSDVSEQIFFDDEINLEIRLEYLSNPSGTFSDTTIYDD